MEMLTELDEELQPLRAVPREIAHRDGLLHAVVHCWVVSRNGGEVRVWFQQRAHTKKDFPDYYDIAVGGHIDVGEDRDAAALREMREEIGLDAQRLQLRYLGYTREEIRLGSFFDREIPERSYLIRLYDDAGYPLGKLYSTQTAIENALKERVWLKHGGYLVIQVTEALTVVDVNSGKSIKKSKNTPDALKLNLEAARETARQIRLRNLSGIILVDFVNMDDPEMEETLFQEFRFYLAKDPIQTTLVDITALGLAEVTRKKVRKPLYEMITV